MERIRAILVILAGTGFWACGGSTPAAPAIVAVPTLAPLPVVGSVRSGITGEEVTADVQTAGSGTTVTAAGYLTRTGTTASYAGLRAPRSGWPLPKGWADTSQSSSRRRRKPHE